jgi:hypothetical protein
MKLTKKNYKVLKIRRNKSKKQNKKRKQSKNNKLRKNKSKKQKNKSNNGGKAIPPSDLPNTVRRIRDADGNLIQQLPLLPPQPPQPPQLLQFPQFEDNEEAPDDIFPPPVEVPEYSDIDMITVDLPEDIAVVRLENVPLAERTPENLEDFNDKRHKFLVSRNHANMARRDGNPFLSLNDVIRLEARVENLRNDVYNRYGRDILEEWEPDQGYHIDVEPSSGSEFNPDDFEFDDDLE